MPNPVEVHPASGAVRLFARAAARFRIRDIASRRYFWRSASRPLAEQGYYIYSVGRGALSPDAPLGAGYLVLPVFVTLLITAYLASAALLYAHAPCVAAHARLHNLTATVSRTSMGTYDHEASIMWHAVTDMTPGPCLGALVMSPLGALPSDASGFSNARLLTHALLHLSPSHLLLNLLFSSAMLLYLEPRYGPTFAALAVLAGALGGGVFSLAFSPLNTVTAGASSIVYALAAVLAFDALVNHGSNLAPLLNAFNGGLGFVALVASSAIGGEGSSVEAHIGGYFAGLGVALLAFPRFTDYRPTDDDPALLTRAGADLDPELGDLELGDLVKAEGPWFAPDLSASLPAAARPRAAWLRGPIARSIGALITVFCFVVAPVYANLRFL